MKKTILMRACEEVPGFSDFHQRMKQKMFITGRSESTFLNYTRYLAAMALHFKKLPITLTIAEVEAYLYHVKQNIQSPSHTFFKHVIYGLRFAYRMEDKEALRLKLPSIKNSKKLPVVLNKKEMVDMINKPLLLKHRVLIALLYGCGLRCFEVRNVKVNDIDFQRKQLHVRQGKGKKDRYLPLGNYLSDTLQRYIEMYQPKTWLFGTRSNPNQKHLFDRMFSQRGIQWAIKSAAKKAGIRKEVNVHSLRHTFATHLLEEGLDILTIKELLGHADIQNTLIYLRVAVIKKKHQFSPIDCLQGVRAIQGLQFKFDFGVEEDKPSYE